MKPAQQANRSRPNLPVLHWKLAREREFRIRKVVWFLVMAVILVLGLELVARFGFGLGDPPLSVEDSKIEYLFAPNQDCHRFGNRIHYNDGSLRNDYDIGQLQRDDVRVLFLGDSVLNGGVLTDQDDLATTIAECDLRAKGYPVRILNASAGSWGPVNCAEYVKRFGTYESKAIYMVLNAGDLCDVPDYTPIVGSRSFPSQKPICAAWDLMYRYVYPRIFGRRKVSRLESGIGLVRGGLSKEEAKRLSLAAIGYCLGQAKKGGIIYVRLRTDWGKATESEAESAFRTFCLQNRIGFYVLTLDPGSDYRDVIHINVNGQRKLAGLMKKLILEAGVATRVCGT